MTEKTITILGKEVRMGYCNATETGYESISGKSIADIDYKSQKDLLMLATAAIVAAYSRDNEEPPITSNELLYDVKPQDTTELIKAVIEIRAAWYGIPMVVEEAIAEEQQDLDESEKGKNA